jgi:DNA-binding NarL/FixJ family response regulator
MRVVIAEDLVLLREGIASLLTDSGHEVVAGVGDGDALLDALAEHDPDLAIVDVRMPPTHTDEGLRAAHEIRERHPETAIVVLSQHVEFGVATRVLAEDPARLAYLLKDRVIDVEDFIGTLQRVAAGGTALDPQVVSRMLATDTDDGVMSTLTPRERDVLGHLAEGLSNPAIAERMDITLRSAEKYVSSIFAKLELPDTGGENRRVLAVLRFLRG